MFSLPEKIILNLIAIFGDAIELLGAAVDAALMGLDFGVTWLFCYFLGFLASAVLFLWVFLKGGGHVGGKYVAKRIITMLAAIIIDEVTGGPLPMKTIGINITIAVNNHYAKKDAHKEESAQKEMAIKAASLARTILKYGKYLLEI